MWRSRCLLHCACVQGDSCVIYLKGVSRPFNGLAVSYYVCFTLNHSTLVLSPSGKDAIFLCLFTGFSLVLPLPYFLLNNSCTLTSSCRVIYQETRSTETLFNYFCEVWQSLLFKAQYGVFKDSIRFLGIKLMTLALLQG